MLRWNRNLRMPDRLQTVVVVAVRAVVVVIGFMPISQQLLPPYHLHIQFLSPEESFFPPGLCLFTSCRIILSALCSVVLSCDFLEGSNRTFFLSTNSFPFALNAQTTSRIFCPLFLRRAFFLIMTSFHILPTLNKFVLLK